MGPSCSARSSLHRVAAVAGPMGSVVAAHGSSCSSECGILVCPSRVKPASPALQGGFYLLILGVLGLCCWVGFSLVAAIGLLTTVGSLVAEHGL